MAKICYDDGDCPLNEICYTNTQLFASLGNGGLHYDFDTSASNDTHVANCFCMQYYGFRRDKWNRCTKFSEFTLTIFLFYAVYIVWALMGFAFTLNCISKLYYRDKLGIDMSSTTLLWLMIGYSCAVAFSALDIQAVLAPASTVKCFENDPNNEKCLKNDRSFAVVYSIWMTSCLLACFNVSLLWIEVYANAHQRHGFLNPIKNIKHYRIPLIGFSLIFLLSKITLGILGKWEWDFALSLPFFALIIIAYSVGYIRMKNLMDISNSPLQISLNVSEYLKNSIYQMKKTTRRVILFSLLYIIDVLAYTYMYQTNWKDFALPKQIPSVMIVDMFEHFFSLSISTSVLLYIISLLVLSEAKVSQTETQFRCDDQEWKDREQQQEEGELEVMQAS